MTFTGITIDRIDPHYRRRTIGASDAPAVVGVSPFEYDTPLMKYLDKLGRLPPRAPTEAMRFGTLLEPLLIKLYEEKTGNTVINRQLHRVHTTIPFMSATLDGTCEDRIIEIKNVGANSPGWDDDSVPDHIIVQTQHQMEVFEAEHTDLVVLHGGQHFRVYPIRRDEQMIKAILLIEGQFWQCVESETPPSWGAIDARALGFLNTECQGEIEFDAVLDNAVLNYELLKSKIKDREAEAEAMKVEILQAMGNAQFARCPSGRIIKRHLVEVAESVSVRKASTRHYFSIVKKGNVLE